MWHELHWMTKGLPSTLAYTATDVIFWTPIAVTCTSRWAAMSKAWGQKHLHLRRQEQWWSKCMKGIFAGELCCVNGVIRAC